MVFLQPKDVQTFWHQNLFWSSIEFKNCKEYKTEQRLLSFVVGIEQTAMMHKCLDCLAVKQTVYSCVYCCKKASYFVQKCLL